MEKGVRGGKEQHNKKEDFLEELKGNQLPQSSGKQYKRDSENEMSLTVDFPIRFISLDNWSGVQQSRTLEDPLLKKGKRQHCP